MGGNTLHTSSSMRQDTVYPGLPVVKAGSPYLLTGTYTGKSVLFKLNGTLLAELPAPSGARGKIVLQQNWWTSVCIRGIGFDAE